MGNLIWLASYPKSGNTWARIFLYNFFENSREPANINDMRKFFVVEAGIGWYKAALNKDELSDEDNEEIARVRPAVHVEMTRVNPRSVFVKTHNI